MAGGMGSNAPRRPGRQSLIERSRASGLGSEVKVASPGAKHCWVRDPPAWPGQWPGLLVEWRQSQPAGGWEGLVVFVVQLEDGPLLVEAWLEAALLVQLGQNDARPG